MQSYSLMDVIKICFPRGDDVKDLIGYYRKNINNCRRYGIKEADLVDFEQYGTAEDKAFGEIIRVIMLLASDESREEINDELIIENCQNKYKENVRALLKKCTKVGAHEGYTKFVKYAALRTYVKQGLDVSYFVVMPPADSTEADEHFNSMSLRSIHSYFQDKLNVVKYKYKEIREFNIVNVGSGVTVDQLKKNRDECVDYGYNQCSELVTTALSMKGLERGQVMLLSAGSSVGKSAYMISSLAKAAVCEFYDVSESKWCGNVAGRVDGAVYVSTELSETEFYKQLLCSVAAVDRSYWDLPLGKEEDMRIEHAEECIRESTIKFVHCPDINKRNIREIALEARRDGIDYMFIDYVESNASLMEEYISNSKNAGGREDSALLDFMKFLKDVVAVGLNMAIMCGSQLSGGVKYLEASNRNATVLANCKSMANKCDISVIMSCIPDAEYQEIMEFSRLGVKHKPNRVISIYKLRAGRYNNINLYGNFDLGTLRWHDVCATENISTGKKGSKSLQHIFMPKTVIKGFKNGYKAPFLYGEEEISNFEASTDDGEGIDMTYEKVIFKRNKELIEKIKKLDPIIENNVMTAEEEENFLKTEKEFHEKIEKEKELINKNELINDDEDEFVSTSPNRYGVIMPEKPVEEGKKVGELEDDFYF